MTTFRDSGGGGGINPAGCPHGRPYPALGPSSERLQLQTGGPGALGVGMADRSGRKPTPSRLPLLSCSLCWAQACPGRLSPRALPGYPGQKHPSPTAGKQQGCSCCASVQPNGVITVRWFNDLRGRVEARGGLQRTVCLRTLCAHCLRVHPRLGQWRGGRGLF